MTELARAANPVRIMVVEDSRGIREVFSETMRDAGFEVTEAADGAEGLHAFKGNPHDLILLDAMMPVMDGLTMCRLLRTLPGGADVPVLMVTARTDMDAVLAAYDAGVSDFIEKPVNLVVLEQRVRRMIATRLAETALQSVNATLERRVQERTNELRQTNQHLHIELAERSRIETALRESEARFRASSEGSLDTFFVLKSLRDATGKIIDFAFFDCNVRTEQFTGLTRTQLIGQPIGQLFPTLNLETFVRVAEARVTIEEELALGIPQIAATWVRRQVVPLADGVAVSLRDITQRKREENQLRYDTLHDALTGLANRAVFVDHLKTALARSKRSPNSTFAVLFIDLDRFKMINDSLGHQAGDYHLIEVGQRLLSCLRPTDTVARFGGDEFAILLDSVVSIADATRLAERIHITLSTPFMLNDHEVFTTASIGIALGVTGYDDPLDVLRDADSALYRAKALGKARHAVFDPSMHEHAMARLRIEAELRRAIRRDELRLHYQPIVDMATNKIIGVEALVRWQHPERGLIWPGAFVPIAEETGLIVPLGAWVMRAACTQLMRWQQHLAQPLFVAVNLAAPQLQPDLGSQVAAILIDTGLDPALLHLELTETSILQDIAATTRAMQELRRLGIREIVIDDFGTGYSSLSRLQQLPISRIKIDRSFVNDMITNPNSATLVRTIIALAQGLHLETVGEGVETEAQRARLQEYGCDTFQGYLSSRPLPAEELQALLESMS